MYEDDEDDARRDREVRACLDRWLVDADAATAYRIVQLLALDPRGVAEALMR